MSVLKDLWRSNAEKAREAQQAGTPTSEHPLDKDLQVPQDLLLTIPPHGAIILTQNPGEKNVVSSLLECLCGDKLLQGCLIDEGFKYADKEEMHPCEAKGWIFHCKDNKTFIYHDDVLTPAEGYKCLWRAMTAAKQVIHPKYYEKYGVQLVSY